MSTSHQSPQSSLPPLKLKTVNTTTWGAGGTTTTISDPYISTNSAIFIWVTGSVPANGTGWAQVVTSGQVVITSTDAESSTLPISYIVL